MEKQIKVGDKGRLGTAVVVQGKNILWKDGKTFTAESARGLTSTLVIYGDGSAYYDNPYEFCQSFRTRVRAWARKDVT